jgi:two-component system sensor kinase FixL
MFGYNREEVIGKGVEVLMTTELGALHETFVRNYKETEIKKIIGKPRKIMVKKKDGKFENVLISLGN